MSEIKSAFSSLPIRELIANPFVAACESQTLLANEYISYVERLAYEDGFFSGGDTRLLKLDLERPTTDAQTGAISTQSVQVKAPLLGLVPIPSLLITTVSVKFNMSVSTSESTTSTSEREMSLSLSDSFWGIRASFSGSVKSSEERTRSSDQSATYEVHVEATQQEPVEGMSKLMDILSSTITPIPGGIKSASA